MTNKDLPYAPPGPVAPDAIRRHFETDDGGFEVGIVIDAKSHRSPLLLGLEWVRVGTEPVSWAADQATHETYYLQQGQLRVDWEGDHNGTAELRRGDSFYFPPSHRYTIVNTGDEDVFLIWSLYPSPDSP
jgi:mannose-6-phosphate isomerase-like protein (cupin superfamily)